MSSDRTVDRVSRDKLAIAYHEVLGKYTDLRKFLNTSHGLQSADPAIDEVRSSPIWVVSDFADGIDPTREQRFHLLRIILFLRSDLPYEYPAGATMSRGSCLLSLATLGLFIPVYLWWDREEIRKYRLQFNLGDITVYPFYRRRDYEAEYAKSCPFALLKVG
jgi:hypothetical protein